MHDNPEDIVISLAGMLQSTALILTLSQQGTLEKEVFTTAIHSIFMTHPTTAISVFGKLENLKLGLGQVIDLFNPTTQTDKLFHRYLLSLMHLEKKLSQTPKLLDDVSLRLAQAKKQVAYFSIDHPTVLHNLADIYSYIVETCKFKVIILGSQRVLHAKINMEKIRILLLAGVRAAMLWRQSGGSRLQMLFRRKMLCDTASKLLKKID